MKGKKYKKLQEIAFGNYDIDYYITTDKVDLARNLSENVFILIILSEDDVPDLKQITPEEAKSIMDKGYKLLWKHRQDIGTTSYDPETGEVKFYLYIAPKKNEKNS